MRSYAGIGSRDTPEHILKLMSGIARLLASRGYNLRSGGARGADKAFESGAGKMCEVFRPNQATPEAIDLASQHHPNWDACDGGDRKLHGRNSMIILGRHLNDPVSFVVCWTKNGGPTGGTGLGIRLAQSRGIRIFNLHDPNAVNELTEYLNNEQA